MPRKLLILIGIAAFLAGFHEWTPPAHAALTCGWSMQRPVYSGGIVTEQNAVSCQGNQWHLDYFLQIEIGGVWQNENCVNTQPCYIRRPASGWYDGGTQVKVNTINFDVRNGCTNRYRVHMEMVSQGGKIIGPVSSDPSIVC